MGTAPAFGRALAPWNGSDLLPLRLRSICSWVTRFYAPPQGGGFASFARLAHSPLRRLLFASSLGGRPLVGWTHRNTALRPGRTVATETLWVTASVQDPKLTFEPDSVRTRFLNSRLTAQFLCRINWSGCDAVQSSRSSEGQSKLTSTLNRPDRSEQRRSKNRDNQRLAPPFPSPVFRPRQSMLTYPSVECTCHRPTPNCPASGLRSADNPSGRHQTEQQRW
jgi:hypothetical protein